MTKILADFEKDVEAARERHRFGRTVGVQWWKKDIVLILAAFDAMKADRDKEHEAHNDLCNAVTQLFNIDFSDDAAVNTSLDNLYEVARVYTEEPTDDQDP